MGLLPFLWGIGIIFEAHKYPLNEVAGGKATSFCLAEQNAHLRIDGHGLTV